MSSSLQVYVGLFCDEGSVPKASTLLMACTQAGIFLSSYYIDITVGFHLYSYLCLVSDNQLGIKK